MCHPSRLSYDMRQMLYLLILAVTLLGCKKQATSRVSIYGPWQWENSIGGFTGSDVIKPIANSEVVLTFMEDMTYSTALNGQITSHGTFQIMTLNSQKVLLINNFATIKGLWMENNGELIVISNSKLHLTDYQVSEPYTHNFK